MLATGHIGAEECFPVVEAARAAGVEKIVITHPEFWVVGMTPEQQADIVRKYDVLLESVYAQPVNGSYKINIPDNIAAMKAIGPEHFVISTDSGRPSTLLVRKLHPPTSRRCLRYSPPSKSAR